MLHVSGHYWPFAVILNKKALLRTGEKESQCWEEAYRKAAPADYTSVYHVWDV